jgi:hypothetical protein
MPVPGLRRTKSGRPGGYTLGGVIGTIHVAGIEPEWLLPLIAGQYVHAGANTHFGFGRYVIDEPLQDDLFRPGCTWREVLHANDREPHLAWVAQQILLPSAEQRLSDSAAASRAGLALRTAARAVRESANCVQLSPGELLSCVPAGLVETKLQTFYPFEPSIDDLVAASDQRVRHALSRVMLDDIAAATAPGLRLLRRGDEIFIIETAHEQASAN